MMTPRERWLAALRMEPVDRLPFWAKLNRSYCAYQTPAWRDKDLDEIHAYVGSDPQRGGKRCTAEKRTNTDYEQTADERTRRTRYITPLGTLEGVDLFDSGSMSWHPRKFPVETLEDVKVLRAWYEDLTVDLDPDLRDEAAEEARRIGEAGPVTTGVGVSPLMYWVEHLAGVERAHYLLLEHPEEVEALFDAIHRTHLRRAEILADQPFYDQIYMVENTSTTLISPDQFRRICIPHLQDYGRVIRGAGRIYMFHMCGLLKALLPDLEKLPQHGNEAFTSPPVGDTTFIDGRTNMPSKCLIGGTNAALWTRPADRIIGELEKHLDALPHHRGLIVSSAGVMPPLASPETIKRVADWVKAYPARMSEAA